MTRALRFFALLSALFVVALRFGSALPLAVVCTEAIDDATSEPECTLSEAPLEAEQLATAAIDDASDDAGDPLLSPSAVEVEQPPFDVASSRGRGVFAADPPITRHGSGLDRPPRV